MADRILRSTIMDYSYSPRTPNPPLENRKHKTNKFPFDNICSNIPRSLRQEDQHFVGRNEDFKALDKTLNSNNSVLIIGAVGVGKTAFCINYGLEPAKYQHIFYQDLSSQSRLAKQNDHGCHAEGKRLFIIDNARYKHIDDICEHIRSKRNMISDHTLVTSSDWSSVAKLSLYCNENRQLLLPPSKEDAKRMLRSHVEGCAQPGEAQLLRDRWYSQPLMLDYLIQWACQPGACETLWSDVVKQLEKIKTRQCKLSFLHRKEWGLRGTRLVDKLLPFELVETELAQYESLQNFTYLICFLDIYSVPDQLLEVGANELNVRRKGIEAIERGSSRAKLRTSTIKQQHTVQDVAMSSDLNRNLYDIFPIVLIEEFCNPATRDDNSKHLQNLLIPYHGILSSPDTISLPSYFQDLVQSLLLGGGSDAITRWYSRAVAIVYGAYASGRLGTLTGPQVFYHHTAALYHWKQNFAGISMTLQTKEALAFSMMRGADEAQSVGDWYSAMDLYHGSEGIYRDCGRNKATERLSALEGYAEACRNNGCLKEAEDALIKVLRNYKAKKDWKRTDHNTLNARRSLASLYLTSGRLTQAYEEISEIVTILEWMSPRSGLSKYCLASSVDLFVRVLINLGWFQDAEVEIDRRRSLKETLQYPDEHLLVSDLNLAEVEFELGKQEKAMSRLESILKNPRISKQTYIMDAKLKLGYMLLSQMATALPGQVNIEPQARIAQRYFKEVRDWAQQHRKRCRGEHRAGRDLATLYAREGIGLAHFYLGDLDEAERELGEVLDLRTTVFGFKHLETLRTNEHLATIIEKRGGKENLDKAQKLFEEVLKEEKELLARVVPQVDHPIILRTRFRVGACYAQQEQLGTTAPKLAVRYLKATIGRQKFRLPKNDPLTRVTQQCLEDHEAYLQGEYGHSFNQGMHDRTLFGRI